MTLIFINFTQQGLNNRLQINNMHNCGFLSTTGKLTKGLIG